MARPAASLILVTRDTVLRADFAREGSPPEVFSAPRPETPDLDSALELALSLTGPIGRKVLFLSSDFWTQSVSVSAMKVNGLTEAELAHALNFEVESLSGQPAVESVAAHRLLTSTRTERLYRVTQLHALDLERWAERLYDEGATLLGAAHPGGLRMPLPLPSGPVAERIELWPDALIALIDEAGNELVPAIKNVDPQSGRAREEINSLVRGRVLPFCAVDRLGTQHSAQVIAFDDPETFTLLAMAWFRSARTDLAPPLVRPAARPLSATARNLISLCLALFVLGLCAAHYAYTEIRVADYETRTKEEKEKKAKIDAVASAIKSKQEDAKKSREEKERIDKTTRALGAARARYSVLLELLAAHRPEGVVIRSIEQSGGSPRVVGLTLQHESVDEYVRRLETPFRELGWEVQPAKESATGTLPNGGPWRFEFTVKEILEPKTTPSTAKGKS